MQACEVLQRADPNSRLVVDQNFRSVCEILGWVNGRFGGLLSHPSQLGFEELFTVVEAEPGRMAVATLPVTVAGEGSAADIRDAEADAVAELCERIIGALTVRGRDGERATPGTSSSTSPRLSCPSANAAGRARADQGAVVSPSF